MVINYPSSYWRINPSSLPEFDPKKDKKRSISAGPLIHLEAVQSLLSSGTFDTDQLWLATVKCEKDLQKERWSIEDVLQMLVLVDGTKDYYKSEWCEVLGGRWVPCDVYRIPYDAINNCRDERGLLVYIKFSIEADGTLTIVLVSCHAA
jgi:hypothetical protein